MITARSARRASEMSPRRDARIAGLLYLFIIVAGAFAQAYVRQGLVVPGDAAATGANLVANEQLYRWGLVADLLPLLCNVILAVIFYRLLSVVNRSVAALAVLFSLLGTAIQATVLVFHIAPMLVLTGGPALGALTEPQVQALAYLSLRSQTDGYSIALVFFGCFGLSLGYLIVRSTFMPRLIGVLMGIAGFCYFTNSLVSLVAPSLSSVLFLLPALVGEASLTLWLIFKGVDSARWESQAASAEVGDAYSDPAGEHGPIQAESM
jgi:hypothetical protein